MVFWTETFFAAMYYISLTLLYFLSCIVLQGTTLDNGLALTPPMGWLSWQRFRCLADCSVYPNECLSEDLIKRTADKMVSDGYLAAGYEYIIIDDCWAEKYRSDDSKLIADSERFPNGMKALSDYIHNLGLKFGIYGDYGYFTCGGYPGSYNYLEQDAQTFADWGVDYLKLDGCYVPNVTSMEEGYARMSNFLNATGRPIVFSCSFPAYKGLEADYSLAVKYCNLWRNYGDIQDQWTDVVDIATWFSDNQDFLRQYAGPGHWNDPDMLIIGNFGLSFEQSKSQMTIWSILAAPLIMSVDLDTIRPEFKEILLNQNAIKINQDALGIPGQLVSNDSDITVWSKPLTGSNGKPGLALGVVSYRVDGYFYPYKIQLSDFFNDVRTEYTITDVFDESSELNGVISGTANITVRVPPSGAVLLMLTP